MKFVEFLGECDSKEWISPKLNNGEFDYWVVLSVLDFDSLEPGRDASEPRFYASLSVVAPACLSDKQRTSVLGSFGFRSDEAVPHVSEMDLVAETYEYGYRAPIWGEAGSCALVLMLAARRFVEPIGLLLGLLLDQPINRIGTSGWSALGARYANH